MILVIDLYIVYNQGGSIYEEDINSNGQIDGNESDPTRREDTGDFDEDGIDNWEEK